MECMANFIEDPDAPSNTPFRAVCDCGWKSEWFSSSARKALSDARWHSGE